MKDFDAIEFHINARTWSVFKLSGLETLSRPYHYAIEFETDEVLYVQAFLNLNARLSMKTKYGTTRLIAGYVHTFGSHHKTGTQCFQYKLDLYSTVNKLTNCRGLANFSNQSIWEMSQTLLYPLGLTPEQMDCPDEQALPVHRLLQQSTDEDGLSFFSRTWAEQGYHWLCETDCDGVEVINFRKTVRSQLELTLDFMANASEEARDVDFEGVDQFEHSHILNANDAWELSFHGHSNCLNLRLGQVLHVKPIPALVHADTLTGLGCVQSIEHHYTKTNEVEPVCSDGVYSNRFFMRDLANSDPPLTVVGAAPLSPFQLGRDLSPDLDSPHAQTIQAHMEGRGDQMLMSYGLSPYGGKANSRGQAIGMGFSRTANTRILFSTYSDRSGLIPIRLGALAHRDNPGSNIDLHAALACLTQNGNGLVFDQHAMKSLQLFTRNKMSSLSLLKNGFKNELCICSTSAGLKLETQQHITSQLLGQASWHVQHTLHEIYNGCYKLNVEENIDVSTLKAMSLETEAHQSYLSQGDLKISQAREIHCSVEGHLGFTAQEEDLALSARHGLIRALTQGEMRLTTSPEGSISITSLDARAGLLISVMGEIEFFGDIIQLDDTAIKLLGQCHYQSDSPHIELKPTAIDVFAWLDGSGSNLRNRSKLCFIDDFERLENQSMGLETLPRLAYELHNAELGISKGAGLDNLIKLEDVEPDQIALESKTRL